MAIWVIWTWIREKRASFLQAMFGFLAGLVAVTPASECMNPQKAMIMSVIVSVLCYIAINFVRPKLGFDDSLDVWGLHGVGGLFGCILIPLFLDETLFDMPHATGQQLLLQTGCALAACAFAFVATWVILKVLGLFMQLRNTSEMEASIDKNRYQEEMYEKRV